jgi:acyl-coenzyme A synthetase/AMP-(fatty) acid ligase
LAIILAGFVVVSIADSFAAKEIATRLRVSKAKGIFTQVIIHFRKISVRLKMWDYLSTGTLKSVIGKDICVLNRVCCLINPIN